MKITITKRTAVLNLTDGLFASSLSKTIQQLPYRQLGAYSFVRLGNALGSSVGQRGLARNGQWLSPVVP
jgi:hypothetical protein